MFHAVPKHVLQQLPGAARVRVECHVVLDDQFGSVGVDVRPRLPRDRLDRERLRFADGSPLSSQREQVSDELVHPVYRLCDLPEMFRVARLSRELDVSFGDREGVPEVV